MLKRPRPGESEEDILRMQEEFLTQKKANASLQPAAQIVDLRNNLPQPSIKSTPVEINPRKQSIYAKAKGQNKSSSSKTQPKQFSSILDVTEKNSSSPSSKPESGDDKVYFPLVIQSVLGDIVEKKFDDNIEFSVDPINVSGDGFPKATKRDFSLSNASERQYSTSYERVSGDQGAMLMDLAEQPNQSLLNNSTINLPDRSYVIASADAGNIHKENVNLLSKMSEEEIINEKEKLMTTLDPKIIDFIRKKRSESNVFVPPDKEKEKEEIVKLPLAVETQQKNETVTPDVPSNDSLWENDVLSHPGVAQWLHFNSLEKDKLEWMKGIQERQKIKEDEPYEARFDFKGYLLPYTIEYTEESKTLFHHGEEPHRPGYSFVELFELSRSAVIQQRVMALNTLAGILEYFSVGTYKGILDIPLSKLLFIIRIAVDENKVILLEPALKALRNLICNRVDEASLDGLIGFEAGLQQPSLLNDKSEIQELETEESELKDFHLAEIDIVTALLRTDIIQRIYYILQTVRPPFHCVQFCLQILTRLARDSVETANIIIEADHLVSFIITNFIPTTSINFHFTPDIVYNGKPILAALKLIRILTLQSKEINEILVSRHRILQPLSEYISSGVDGTYGLRLQTEAYCIFTNLLQFQVGLEAATDLTPLTITTLYKHVQGTDIFITSSIPSATHAAVVLQYINQLLWHSYRIDMQNNKHKIYPLLKEGLSKWVSQLSQSTSYSCAHLRLLSSVFDCCRTILIIENMSKSFVNNVLLSLVTSRGFRELSSQTINCSNLLSRLESKDMMLAKNFVTLGTAVLDYSQKILPIMNITSPFPMLVSLLKLLIVVNDKTLNGLFLEYFKSYLTKFNKRTPALCENWFTRVEISFVFCIVKLYSQLDLSESVKDVVYTTASRVCYILRADQIHELEFLLSHIVFNKVWFTAERLLNVVSLSESNSLLTPLNSVDNIKLCYAKVISSNYQGSGPSIMLKKWQEPALPRDWIYLPILQLYNKSQELDTHPNTMGDANRVAAMLAKERELIITCSLEWILFNELCFPDLLNDISVTDRFCRLLCVFLCDNSSFLEPKIKNGLEKCLLIMYKNSNDLDFEKPLSGLSSFEQLFTQVLEQFQSVSYGDANFASVVLAPLASRHHARWRNLLWSQYAGCLRALDCPEHLLPYPMEEYLIPEETDESLLRCYKRALTTHLLRPDTVAFKIASYHVAAHERRMATS